jgi:hypothetical protein
MYGSHKEIYFQPLKVCVATINTGLFYFMPLIKKFCTDEDLSISLEIFLNMDKGITFYINNEDIEVSLMINLEYELIDEIVNNILQVKRKIEDLKKEDNNA